MNFYAKSISILQILRKIYKNDLLINLKNATFWRDN